MNKPAPMVARALVLLLSVALWAGCSLRRDKYETPIVGDSQQPDKTLFDQSVLDLERGRYEIARLTLQTLLNTYPDSEYLAKAKLAIADSWYRHGGTSGWLKPRRSTRTSSPSSPRCRKPPRPS